MDKEELRELVNKRYLERKVEKGLDIRYKAPEQIEQIKVQSDQVNALIDVIAEELLGRNLG